MGSVASTGSSGAGNASAMEFLDVLYSNYNPSNPNTAGTLNAYTIDTGTGALIAAGTGIATGASPTQTIVTPNGGFSYVLDPTAGTLSAYAVNASTAALSAVAGSPFSIASSGYTPQSVVIDSTGKYLYVASNNASNLGQISAFAIASTGAISPISGAVYALPGPLPASSLGDMVTTPAGELYVATSVQSGSAIQEYQISSSGSLAATGSPTPVSESLDGPMVVSGSFLYALAGNPFASSNDVFGYAIGSTNGGLTLISHWSAGSVAVGLASNPKAGQIYVTAQGTAGSAGVNGQLFAFAVSPTSGNLTAFTGSPYATGASPFGVTVDPSGNFVYVANAGSGSITGFQIGASTNSLTILQAGNAMATGNTPTAVMAATAP